MGIRDNFIEKFSEQQAIAIELAANEHKNGVHDKYGSDPFKWALLICIGYECISRPEFRQKHGIIIPFNDLKQWIIDHGDLASHDGDVDYLSLFCGVYEKYIKAKGTP